SRVFCATCGAMVPELMGDQVGIPAGTLDGEQNLRPRGHIFVDGKAPWYEIADNLPQFATKPSA
ncbi:MAG: GFA family protein, partial [Candidatus Binataceae bacterium]